VAVRVLVVDDYRLVAECLQRLLQDSFEIVDWVQDAGAAISRSQPEVPDVIVIGTSAPGFSWLKTLRCLVRGIPSAKVLLVATEESRTHLKAAFREGARGYVLMRSPVSELVAAIWIVLAGGTYITSLIAPTTITRLHGAYQLTRRQMAIMDLIASGKTAQEMSALLGISEKTVDFHRTGLLRDLGFHSSCQLIRFAHTDALTLQGEASTLAPVHREGSSQPPPSAERAAGR
jgi:DNA-binding NarL/FixJ family response regulator